MHKLKKYTNRRLYDLTTSKYVTIDDVRKIIVSGESIEVTDARDDSDITRSVLLQILAEQESQGRASVLTNRVMEQIIRLYGDAFGEMASRYVEQSLLTFLEHQDQYRTRMRELSSNRAFSAMREAFERNTEFWSQPGGPGRRDDSKG